MYVTPLNFKTCFLGGLQAVRRCHFISFTSLFQSHVDFTLTRTHLSDQVQLIRAQIDASFSRTTSVWQDLNTQRKLTEVFFSLLVLLALLQSFYSCSNFFVQLVSSVQFNLR